MNAINRHDFPELNKLLWDVHNTNITPKVAYQCYEQRWHFVDKNNMSQTEKELLETLTKTVGKGLFMPAND